MARIRQIYGLFSLAAIATFSKYFDGRNFVTRQNKFHVPRGGCKKKKRRGTFWHSDHVRPTKRIISFFREIVFRKWYDARILRLIFPAKRGYFICKWGREMMAQISNTNASFSSSKYSFFKVIYPGNLSGPPSQRCRFEGNYYCGSHSTIWIKLNFTRSSFRVSNQNFGLF